MSRVPGSRSGFLAMRRIYRLSMDRKSMATCHERHLTQSQRNTRWPPRQFARASHLRSQPTPYSLFPASQCLPYISITSLRSARRLAFARIEHVPARILMHRDARRIAHHRHLVHSQHRSHEGTRQIVPSMHNQHAHLRDRRPRPGAVAAPSPCADRRRDPTAGSRHTRARCSAHPPSSPPYA